MSDPAARHIAANGNILHRDCAVCGTTAMPEPLTPYDPIALPDSHGRGVRGRFISDEEYHRTGAPQAHAEVVSARIAAFPRAVQAVRNCDRAPLSEKDILRLAVELVK